MTPRTVRESLRSVLVGQSGGEIDACRVSVHPRHHLSFIEWPSDASRGRWVAKDMGIGHHRHSPLQLQQTCQQMIAAVPSLADALPEIIGVDANRNWAILRYIPGRTMESVLRCRQWRLPCLLNIDIDDSLRRLAHVLMAMASATPAGAGFRTNDSARLEFESIFTDPVMQRYVPVAATQPSDVYAAVHTANWPTVPLVYTLGDGQPKNVIVAANASPRLIDIDFGLAPLALGVAHFLVGIDRIGLWHPTAGARTMRACWKQTLVRAVVDAADDRIVQNLALLYPTLLIRMCRLHTAARPVLGRWLRWHYGGCLGRFLHRLTASPSHDWRVTVAEAFGA